jgi:hypothetical protein
MLLRTAITAERDVASSNRFTGVTAPAISRGQKSSVRGPGMVCASADVGQYRTPQGVLVALETVQHVDTSVSDDDLSTKKAEAGYTV